MTWYSSFFAGLATSLSPCIYPMIPVTIGYLSRVSETSPKRSLLLFFLGQVLALTGLGLAAAQVGEVFGFSSESRSINLGLGLLLLFFGIFSLKGGEWSVTAKFNTWIQNRLSGTGLWGAFIFGAGSALVASPCTSPTLGAVLSGIAQDPSSAKGIFYMFCYSLGLGLIFLLIGFGLNKVISLPKPGVWTKRIHQLITMVIFGGAIFYLYRAL